MGKIFYILFSVNIIFASSSHTFLINKYSKEIELEAKIIANIAKSSLKVKDIRIFIPDISSEEKSIYSKYLNVVENCNNANFAFLKNKYGLGTCNNNERIYFSSSYRMLMSDAKYIGAFFWSKSRPNVVFLQDRLDKYNITLPSTYDKYIENF